MDRGRVRAAVIDPQGNAQVNDFGPGDVGDIPHGYGHLIENVGGEPCRVLIGLNAGVYEASDLTQWVAGKPPDVLATNFGNRAALFGTFPRKAAFIADKDSK